MVTVGGAAVVDLVALLAWQFAVGRGVGDQTVLEVLGVALGGTAVTVAAFAGIVWAARAVSPRGYRNAVTAFIVPALLILAAWGIAHVSDDADWAWQVVLLTLGVIVLPLAIVLFSYYVLSDSTPGPGGRLPRQITVTLLVVAELVIFLDLVGVLAFDTYVSGDHVLPTLAGVLGVTAFVLWLQGRLWDKVAAWLAGHDPRISGWAAAVAWGVVIAIPVIRFWDAWAVKAGVACAGAVVILLGALLFAAVLASGGARALFKGHLRRGRLDPDRAAAYVQQEYGSNEVARTRLGEDPDDAAGAFGKLLLSKVGDRKQKAINNKISEAGNADIPPMFKNFMHVAVSADGRWLELRCFGVSGWRRQEGNVPVEDHFVIDLALARGDQLRSATEASAGNGEVNLPGVQGDDAALGVDQQGTVVRDPRGEA
jgi:hypothetical protein